MLQTPFWKDAFRIDSVLGRTPCRGCQMPGFAFMQANYLNDVGLWTTIGIEMFCRPFGKVFLTFLEHQGVEIFQACFGVPKWQQTRTHKEASSVKCVANHARSIQSRRAESPTNSAWDLSNLLCLSRSTAPANELKREPTSPFLLLQNVTWTRGWQTRTPALPTLLGRTLAD